MSNSRPARHPRRTDRPGEDFRTTEVGSPLVQKRRIHADAEDFLRRAEEIETVLQELSAKPGAPGDGLLRLARRAPGALRFVANAVELSDDKLDALASAVGLSKRTVEQARHLRPSVRLHKSTIRWAEQLVASQDVKKDLKQRAKRMMTSLSSGSSAAIRLEAVVLAALNGGDVVPLLRAFFNESSENQLVVRALAAGERMAAKESESWGLTARERVTFLKWIRRHSVLEASANDVVAESRGVTFTWTNLEHRAMLRLVDGHPLVDFDLFSKGRSILAGIAEYDDLLRLVRTLLGSLASIAEWAATSDQASHAFVQSSLEAVDEIGRMHARTRSALRECALRFPGMRLE